MEEHAGDAPGGIEVDVEEAMGIEEGDAMAPYMHEPDGQSHQDGQSSEEEVEVDITLPQASKNAKKPALDGEEAIVEVVQVNVMPEPSGPVQPTPLPRLQTFALCLVLFSDAMAITMLFPFLNQMVARFMGLEDEDDRQEVGYYSGYLASAFFLAQTLSSYGWGWLSEQPKIGKKRVLQFGMSTTIVSLLVFGFSFDYWMAMGARILWGFCNANFPTAKSVIYLMSDETNRARGFSLVGFMWGFGSIVGPIIGGFFSELILVDSFPYALPCVMTAALCALALAAMSLFLTEPTTKGAKLGGAAQIGEEDEDVGIELEEMGKKEEVGKEAAGELDEEVAATVDISGLGPTQMNATKMDKVKLFMRRHWTLVVSTITYALVAFVVISFDELFPLWAIQSESNNGLAFSTFEIGCAWFISGVTLLVFQGYVYSKITSFFGALNIFQGGAILGVVIIMAYPALALPRACFGLEFWVVALPVFSGRAVFASCMFTSANILVANSSTIPIGKANGIAATVGGIMKGLGPAVTTNLYAWSSTSGYLFPVNYLAAFLLLASLCIISLWTSLLLPKRVGFLAMDE